MGKRLDALPGTELGGSLCRDAAERCRGAYIWKQFILTLVHEHIANTTLETVNRRIRQAGSVQEHSVCKYSVRKVTVHLQKVLDMRSMSIYTGLSLN